ncbi:endothelial cell-specific chemotaxis regulator [Astyanax mexicanus]|uniref:endothelial cell-specific chemotaxis regulator n=1 Tax=Astyanax mexicanus TaxID=7994 RepID=UPI0020CAAD65|nr:endothelial cell-specific chemotaxis regulator [Astyanax mexicanus]
MDLLLYSSIVLCVSLSLISAEDKIKEKETSSTSAPSTPSAVSTVTTAMANTSSVTNTTTTASVTRHTEGNTTSRNFSTISPSSSPGQPKLFSPTPAAFTSHTSESSNTKSRQITASSAGTNQSGHEVLLETSTPGQASNISLRRSTDEPTAVPPTQPPGNSLTMLAFGVMSFILVLIIVMIILVTAVNLRGRCHNTKEEGVKNYDSVISESNLTSTGEKESITLVSVRSINTDTDTDSPQISSVHSTILDSEDQEPSRDHLLSGRAH